MKKVLLLMLAAIAAVASQAQKKTSVENVYANRAPVAVMTKTGVLVSWRSFKSDAPTLGFDVYRGTTKLNSSPITTKTNFLDDGGVGGETYTIKATNGEAFTVTAWDNMYKTIAVARPPKTKEASGGLTGRYRPDEISIGDVDGDGEFEMIIKWLPDNQRDSGKTGKASPTYLTCNKMDGTQLWRINLGHNIRSGNHNMTFLVYDFDGDGYAELICRTAAGSTDGKGNYVSEAGAADIKATDNSKTYQSSNGYVNGGEEFLTVFNGKTGAAMHTIWYWPNRGLGYSGAASNSSSWGDKTGNRCERFNAAVAYLDGEHPTAIMQRGYYTLCYIWAVDWDGTQLKTKWLHNGKSKTAWEVLDANKNVINSGTGKSSYGQGVHGITIADVNGDGKDDICTGGATIGHDGRLLCSTGFGHGDAIHVGDLIPDRPGLELMMPHEEVATINGVTYKYGYDVHDATTGEVIVSGQGEEDTGRGLACDFIPSHKGSEFWSSVDKNMYACEDGTVLNSSKPDTNFRIYWTGDPFDQTFDGCYDSNTAKSSPRIRAWNTASKKIVTVQEFAAYDQPQSSNSTKGTPCLQADFLGDWREELIMWEYEGDWESPTCKLLVFSTPQPTEYKVPCLLEDHQYRMAVVWQNASYNQPPHLSYSLAESLGVNRATYTTNVVSNAAPTEQSDSGTETLAVPSADKGVVTGLCYTAGENGEITDSKSGDYIKIRTGNSNQLVFSVNEGYVITGISVEGYSNNKSTTADRSITLTGIYIDGADTSVLTSNVVFPGGTAGQNAVTAEASGFRAEEKIVLTFDNSHIDTNGEDSAGKNKQIFAKVTFTYEKVTDGIKTVHTETVVLDGSQPIYNLNGMKVNRADHGVFIVNGKKIRK